MRIHLKLTYVFLRTCDSDGDRRFWVGWCPELDCMSQGHGLQSATWMLRECVRITIEGMIRQNTHPLRAKLGPEDQEHDLDYKAYQEFLRYQNDGDGFRWREWTTEYDSTRIPDTVDTCFMAVDLWVDTFGGACLIDEGEAYGRSYVYRTGELVRVKMLIETTCEVESRRLGGEPNLENMRRVYGLEVREIIGWEKVD